MLLQTNDDHTPSHFVRAAWICWLVLLLFSFYFLVSFCVLSHHVKCSVFHFSFCPLFSCIRLFACLLFFSCSSNRLHIFILFVQFSDSRNLLCVCVCSGEYVREKREDLNLVIIRRREEHCLDHFGEHTVFQVQFVFRQTQIQTGTQPLKITNLLWIT